MTKRAAFDFTVYGVKLLPTGRHVLVGGGGGHDIPNRIVVCQLEGGEEKSKGGPFEGVVCEYDAGDDVVWNMAVSNKLIAFSSPDRLTLLRLDTNGEDKMDRHVEEDRDMRVEESESDDMALTKLCAVRLYRAQRDIGRKVLAMKSGSDGEGGWIVTCDDHFHVLVYRIMQTKEGKNVSYELQLHAILKGHENYVSDVDLQVCKVGNNDGDDDEKVDDEPILHVCSVGEDLVLRVWRIHTSSGESDNEYPKHEALFSVSMHQIPRLNGLRRHEPKACKFWSNGDGDQKQSVLVMYTARSGPTLLSHADISKKQIVGTGIVSREASTSMCVNEGVLALGCKDGVLLLKPRRNTVGRWRKVAEASRIHSFPVSCIDLRMRDEEDTSSIKVVSGSIDRSVVIYEAKMKQLYMNSPVIGLLMALLVLLLALAVYRYLSNEPIGSNMNEV